MCEQTEINYLDGDVVWVKLGSHWWPGQVVGLEKLPEDIQIEFQKKPLIAAVKFFQEESFEFVKNYQQIYKYNCTQKDDFIRKGLDKYRTKSKDGSNYMNKFPEDVKTAEILTNGDPDILFSDQFSPQEKPDISGLFGEKKISKKKRNRDELLKKNDCDMRRRITHPRFLRENDHEIRIRQQPTLQPSLSNNSSPGGIYPCHVCGFTATRVNVIICHLKNHRLNNETNTSVKLKLKTSVQSKSRQTNLDVIKRKYVRKLMPSKSEYTTESGKRKHFKQVEKSNKKKKSDPELREKLLADWNVDSDEDESLDFTKSFDTSMNESSKNMSSSIDVSDKNQSCKDNEDSMEFLQESDKLLQETDSFAKLSMLQNVSNNFNKLDMDENNSEQFDITLSPNRSKESLYFKKSTIEKSNLKDKDDKISRLSCFDFNEEDISEPSMSSVRKISRSSGNKNISIKKEIIKEFEMIQALQNDMEKDSKHDEISKTNLLTSTESPTHEKKVETVQSEQQNKNITEEVSLKHKNNDQISNEKLEKNVEDCETQVEIVEIFEVEKEEEKIVKNEVEINMDTDMKVDVENKSIQNDDICKKNVKSDNVVKEDKCNIFPEDEKDETIEKKPIRKKIQNQLIDTHLEVECDKNEHELVQENKPLKSVEVKNEEFVIFKKDSISTNSSNLLKNNLLNEHTDSTQESKQTFHSEEKHEIISNELVTEIKEDEKDKTTLTVNSITQAKNTSDIEDSSNLKSTEQLLSKNEENLNSTEDKQREIPKTNLENAEKFECDSEHLNCDDDFSKQKNIESSRKTPDVDLNLSDEKIKSDQNDESSSCLQKFDDNSLKINESSSESFEQKNKVEPIENKLNNSKNIASDNIIIDTKDEFSNLKASPSHANTASMIEVHVTENISKIDLEGKELINKQKDSSNIDDISEQSKKNIMATNSDNKNVCENNKYAELSENFTISKEEMNVKNETNELQQNTDIDLLPPKKSQIKKFELSKIDVTESDTVKSLDANLNAHLPKNINEKKSDIKENFTEQVLCDIEIEHKTSEVAETIPLNTKEVADKVIDENVKVKSTLNVEKSNQKFKVNSIEKCESVVVPKTKKTKFEDNQYDSFQDAFVKTLQIDNSVKTDTNDSTEKLEIKDTNLNSTKNIITTGAMNNQKTVQEPTITNFSLVDNFDSIEVVVANSSELETKSNVEESLTKDKQSIPTLNDNSFNIQKNNILVIQENAAATIDAKEKKASGSSDLITTPLAVEEKVTVPVKKREKPRIIENVALKEPMILKTKLLEKRTGKIGKHKLDNDNLKSDDTKTFPKTKVMKMEPVIAHNKNKLHSLSSNQILTMTKKVIKTLKTEDNSVISPKTDTRNEQVMSALPKTITEVPCSEKYIQQSSQSLVDMELDINSMPFVLSEDVLTPESIEQMPVLISSIPPANLITTTIPATLVTQTKQVTVNQSLEQPKELSETNLKKKSGIPTILKNKTKAKPTITSIKTIIPPLTSAAYKGGCKVNTQALKTSLDNQKTSGKYVIVQTAGHQQAYSTHQKVLIPTSKGSGNAQIVQQGSKVVILTSPQSAQPGQKVVPINSLTKVLNSGKVQKFITTKQSPTVYTSVGQTYVGKPILTSKCGDFSSSSTSKATGQNIVGQQQTITSKSVLTQLPGTITKCVFTPITSATLGGKTVINSKTLVSKSFPTQSTSASKNILSPLSQSLTSKTIISSQGIVPKGTVLTPITGLQVKALAARKGNKLQNEHIQRKLQATGNSKNSKISMSPSSMQNVTNTKTSSNIVVLQNTELKTVTPNKRGVKYVQKQAATKVLSPSTITTVQQKDKIISTNIEQKVASPKNINKSLKLQQKIIPEKSMDYLQLKSVVNEKVPVNTNVTEQQQVESLPVMKNSKSMNKNLQKRVSNTNTTVLSPINISDSPSNAASSIESINSEQIPKKEVTEQITLKEETVVSSTQRAATSEVEKVEETKTPMQTQIMALPTENNDGTQTYILVTVNEQGHVIPLDNNTLMSLDGTSNFDGSKTIYIDSSSLNESGNVENIVLQIDNESICNLESLTAQESAQAVARKSLSSSDTIQATNQDILAAALANTDFQHEIGTVETSDSTTMTSLTQTSLINQTILQSTIIPPTEPISSPLVLETSLTLNQPIMTPLEIPSNLPIQSELTSATSTTNSPSSLELPITTLSQNVSYITTKDSVLQVSGNSMPEIENAIETSSIQKAADLKIPASTESITKSNLVKNVISKTQEGESMSVIDISTPKVHSDKTQDQVTSMPLIEDSFQSNSGFDSSNASAIEENNLKNLVTKTSEELMQDLMYDDITENNVLQENKEALCSENIKNNKNTASVSEVLSEAPQIILNDEQDDCISSQQGTVAIAAQSKENTENEFMECSSEINKKILNTNNELIEACTPSSEISTDVQMSNAEDQTVKAALTASESVIAQEDQSLILNQEFSDEYQPKTSFTNTKSSDTVPKEENDEKTVKTENETNQFPEDVSIQIVANECKIVFEDKISETSQESPSQSYEQLLSAPNEVSEVSSQSTKSENSREAAQSLSYQSLQIDDNAIDNEPPSQSYKDSKQNKTAQYYQALSEISPNAPTQSVNEIMEVSEEKESVNDTNFPTQSYEIGKIENSIENGEIDTKINQEGNTPSQSNDIGVDGIGTSSVSTNNSGVNEDETASSSYVPETPENQERDQDQESAISTSSYEIPPCEELNIASSSVIPDTSVQSEHSNIHNNGIPDIPTSSYNLNPDSSSTHIDSVPTSSFEDQVVVEQSVSTSYQIPISIANLEDATSQNYVTDSSIDKNEPTSYYSHHHEVTESYYKNMCKQSNSQLEINSEEEATPSYYVNNPADVTSEASQSYFNQEEATPSYSNHDISPSYYDAQVETEATQSYYSSHNLNRSGQAALQNVEATQSFYQENSDEQRLEQRGEATPTDYVDRYSVDYVPVSSPLDRHDLVESSVPAKSMNR